MAPMLASIRRIRRIHSEEDLTSYAQGYRRAGAHPLPLEPLRGREVWAAFDRRGEMIGGFVFGTRAPYRTIGAIPPAVRAGLDPGVLPPRTAEVCCMWIERAHRHQPVATALWLTLGLRILVHRPRGLLYGTAVSRFKEFFELTGWTRPLYHGPLVVDGVQMAEGWVYVCPLADFVLWLPVALRHRRRRRHQRSAPAPRRAVRSLVAS